MFPRLPRALGLLLSSLLWYLSRAFADEPKSVDRFRLVLCIRRLLGHGRARAWLCCLALGWPAVLAIGCVAAVNGCSSASEAGRKPLQFSQLLSLPNELVFAYSRISPDGRFLVFSSQPAGPGASLWPDLQRLRVVDLTTQETVFDAPGIDGYWSVDASRLIFKRRTNHGSVASIWNRLTGETSDLAIDPELGDYYSWGRRGDVDRIMTIKGWVVDLEGGRASAPERLRECAGIGVGDRPLISPDGTKASVFVADELVLRTVDDCGWIHRTGLVGAKADWSTDGRWVAFHTPKLSSDGYDLGVYDVKSMRFHRIALGGSIYFPSWTRSGSLVFRYDGPDFQGFMRVDNPHSAPIEERRALAARRPTGRWQPRNEAESTFAKAAPVVVVMFWSALGAHSSRALADLAAASVGFCDKTPVHCAMVAARDASVRGDQTHAVSGSLRRTINVVPVSVGQMLNYGAANQNPTYLLFLNGCLDDRLLGAMRSHEIREWVTNRTRARKAEVARPRGEGGCIEAWAPSRS